jgi:ureidoacrylate peracid hydrolase
MRQSRPRGPVGHGPTSCIDNAAAARDTAIVHEVAPHAEDLIVTTPRHSGFFHTDLHEQLRACGVDQLVFTGVTTSSCVESTVRDAAFRD